MQNVITDVDNLGVHTFECPGCKHENFLGWWDLNKGKYTSPMEWIYSYCGKKVLVFRNKKQNIK